MELAGLYNKNLTCLWKSLLPAPDVWVLRQNGTARKVDQTVQSIALHYLSNAALFALSLAALPITFSLSLISPLFGRVKVIQPPPSVEPFIPDDFGFANSGFQDGAIGTSLDLSTLKGMGTNDWEKIFQRLVQRVTPEGRKLEPITNGVTMLEGRELRDLFTNTMDYPDEFASFLASQNCTAYRISLERSVIEPKKGEFNRDALKKYAALFKALISCGIKPYVTLHHFTNPQWFEEAGGFENEENIEGFVSYSSAMVQWFPMVENWITFNEPGIRALEGYIRGEHPPEKKDLGAAAQVIRNLLVAHERAYILMKTINTKIRVGITHQWLKFLPFGNNPIEKITAFFLSHVAHTSLLGYYREGRFEFQVPFRANVQLLRERKGQFSDFLGVQNYGFPQIKVGLHRGGPMPGAADKVMNYQLPFGFWFTAGSTCGEGQSAQYFGPPSHPEDLGESLAEASSLPREMVGEIGVTETGADARRMRHGATRVLLDEKGQASDLGKLHDVAMRYKLTCFFFWTLNRHCEWRSGGVSLLGVTKTTFSRGYSRWPDSPAMNTIVRIFGEMVRVKKEKAA